ncbi:hypothetical protein [Blastomonas sp. CCH1-A6]|jgi:hypothetical protein|uniref:hypothetical protein n=1 Tax=Blastomonas sp. CCH1-A6 TaxID=1768762 RepID=UPI00082AFEFE
MTPLERAKAAIAQTLGFSWLPIDAFALPDGRMISTEALTRAVLTAIREPDRAMIEAGGEQVLDTEVGDGQYASIADGRGSKLMANNQAVNAWTAMIDAILAGSE